MKKYNKNIQKWERIQSIMPAGAGHKRVVIIRYGQLLTGTLTVMPLFDAWNSEDRGWKIAGNRIYDIIVSQN